MRYQNEIDVLEAEWSPEDGFLWRIREGEFSSEPFQRMKGKLSCMAIGEESEIPRRLASLLWYIPLVMEWQVDRVGQRGGDVAAYRKAIALMTVEVERLLGTP